MCGFTEQLNNVSEPPRQCAVSPGQRYPGCLPYGNNMESISISIGTLMSNLKFFFFFPFPDGKNILRSIHSQMSAALNTSICLGGRVCSHTKK